MARAVMPVEEEDPKVTVSLVVTDLDGTLWHTDDRVEATVLDAWAELERRGIPVLVATGRRPSSTRDPLARVGLAPPAVMLNGALGFDLATGARFHRAPYLPDAARSVLDAFRSVSLEPVVYVDHPRIDAFLSPEPSTNPVHVSMLAPTAATDDLARVVLDETVLGFSLIGVPFAQAEAAAAAIGDRAEVHLDRSLDFDGLASFTVAPKGQSKWDGVMAFCADNDLDPSRVIALADGPNDLELLDNAAVALVPKVSHPDAVARAHHVVPAAAEGGWAHVLDHLG